MSDLIRTRQKATSPVTNPTEVAEAFKKYSCKRVEHFLVATLDAAHAIRHVYVSTVGLVSRTMVHPREVFWFAIKDMASAIIVAHNHPSGIPDPSPEDIEVTKRLKEAGELVGIDVLDHLILCRNGWISMRERGIF